METGDFPEDTGLPIGSGLTEVLEYDTCFVPFLLTNQRTASRGQGQVQVEKEG